tara:strand:- start:6832 stop:8205 length:1374 start_codon:yes stop_codon:yes gene_type:complete
MKFNPREHQQMMIDHITSRPASMVIAGMGLGKTASTLASIEHLILNGEIRGALIVAPLRVTNLTWGNEAAKWDDFSWLVIANLRTEEGMRHWENKSADVYLINYEQLMTRGGNGFCKDHLQGVYQPNLPVDMVVWDEISKAKDPQSKRIKAFAPHRNKFKFHVGLTGTPTPNSYLDLFAQIRLLDGGDRLGLIFSRFQKEYFESDYMGYKWTALKGSEELIQRKISDMTITLRSEDYLDIPDVIVEDHCVNLPDKARKQYKELQKELLLMLEKGEIEAVNAAVLAGKLLQITGGAAYDLDKEWHVIHSAKINELAKIRKMLKKEGENMLVIYHFKHELARIQEAFPEAEKFSEERMDAWNRGEIPMMLANAMSVGHGLNLQEGANQMVWFTLTYSRELYDQTNARLARTGQTKKTYIRRILCNDSIDDAVAEALREKGESQSGLLLALKNLQTLNNQ